VNLSDLVGIWACRPDELRALSLVVVGTPKQPAGLDVRSGVATVRIAGMLAKSVPWWADGTSTIAIEQQVNAAAASPDVNTILLHIESPGGLTPGVNEAAQAIRAAAREKLVVAYASDLCCSAAYWLAASASRIYANPTAIVGSIGTYGVVVDSSALADKLGVKVHVVRAGQFKGSGFPGTKIEQAHLDEHQKLVNAINEHFVGAVQTGRRMSRTQALAVADGRSHVGQAAVAAGLVDQILSFGDVWATLAAGRVPASPQAATRGATTRGPKMYGYGSVKEQLEELIAAKLERNPRLSPQEARLQVYRENPELRAEFVREHNEQHNAPRR
jgi:signal peptide peptidase SppA